MSTSKLAYTTLWCGSYWPKELNLDISHRRWIARGTQSRRGEESVKDVFHPSDQAENSLGALGLTQGGLRISATTLLLPMIRLSHLV